MLIGKTSHSSHDFLGNKSSLGLTSLNEENHGSRHPRSILSLFTFEWKVSRKFFFATPLILMWSIFSFYTIFRIVVADRSCLANAMRLYSISAKTSSSAAPDHSVVEEILIISEQVFLLFHFLPIQRSKSGFLILKICSQLLTGAIISGLVFLSSFVGVKSTFFFGSKVNFATIFLPRQRALLLLDISFSASNMLVGIRKPYLLLLLSLRLGRTMSLTIPLLTKKFHISTFEAN